MPRNDLLLSRNELARQGVTLPPVTPPRGRVPELRPGSGMMPPRPASGAATLTGADAERVLLAGGDLLSLTLHPEILPFEQLYRRLPEEGMFDPTVAPDRPFVFELGAFRVPPKMTLALYDLRPDIYRFSGIDAGDFVPVEARRFASILGFQLSIDQRNSGNVLFQIDPAAIERTSQQAFQPPINQLQPAASFNIAASQSYANVAGIGAALLPQRPTRYGALSIPFTLFAQGGQVVQVRCAIFRPIPSPIAFIEYDIAGILVPQKWMDAIIRAIEPTREQVR
jgi:hypothetical protein